MVQMLIMEAASGNAWSKSYLINKKTRVSPLTYRKCYFNIVYLCPSIVLVFINILLVFTFIYYGFDYIYIYIIMFIGYFI